MRLCSLLLVLCLASLVPNAAEAGKKDDLEYLAAETFYNSGYTYCDAVHVAEAWGKGDSWTAKVRVGGWARKGKQAKADKAIFTGRTWADQAGSVCEFDADGYLYEDAEAIGALWGVDAWQAKVQMSSMIRQQNWWMVDEAMRKAGRYDEKYTDGGYYEEYDNCDVGMNYVDPNERIAAYSGYDACDSALLSSFWNVTLDEVYARIGETVAKEGKVRVEQDLQSARTFPSDSAREACDYFQSNYNYNDAELLAGVWGLEDPYAAKTKISELRLAGKDAVVRSALASARGY